MIFFVTFIITNNNIQFVYSLISFSSEANDRKQSKKADLVIRHSGAGRLFYSKHTSVSSSVIEL